MQLPGPGLVSDLDPVSPAGRRGSAPVMAWAQTRLGCCWSAEPNRDGLSQQEIVQGQIGLGGVKTALWSLAPHRSPTSNCREVEAVTRRKMGERGEAKKTGGRATCDGREESRNQQPTRARTHSSAVTSSTRLIKFQVDDGAVCCQLSTTSANLADGRLRLFWGPLSSRIEYRARGVLLMIETLSAGPGTLIASEPGPGPTSAGGVDCVMRGNG